MALHCAQHQRVSRLKKKKKKKKKKPEVPWIQLFKYSPSVLLYAYEWKLINTDVTSIAQHLTDFTQSHVSHTADLMTPDSLHCTSHVSLGPDSRYEEVWYNKQKEPEQLVLNYVYWTEKAAVVSVSLSSPQEKVFIGSTPHVSLARSLHWHWQDLDPWLQHCLRLLCFGPVAEDPIKKKRLR